MPDESEAGQAKQLSPTRTRHKHLGALIAVAILVPTLFVGVLAGVLYSYVWPMLECSPPSLDALKVQEAFVRSHLSDASGIESGTLDCDDNGDGYVYFATSLTPAAARDAFLTDEACSPHSDEGGDIAVVCMSAGEQVYVFFHEEAGRTAGELSGIGRGRI